MSNLAVDDKDIHYLVVDNKEEFQRFKRAMKKNGAVTNGKIQQFLPMYIENRRSKMTNLHRSQTS